MEEKIMEEKWIKVYEIEYLSKDLSRIYKNIDNKYQKGHAVTVR